MATANSAALAAPALPMAKVATGMPLGICTMLCSESTPCKCLLATGTPSTGTVVLAASMHVHHAAYDLVAQTQPFRGNHRSTRAGLAVIADLQPHTAGVTAPLDADKSASGGVLQGVINKVAQGQFQQQRMGEYLQPIFALHAERVSAFPGVLRATGHDLPGKRAQVQPLHLLLQVGAAGPRQREQLGDDMGSPQVMAYTSPLCTMLRRSRWPSACSSAVSRSALVSISRGRTLRYSAILRCVARRGVSA